jgi:hypothetical protein
MTTLSGKTTLTGLLAVWGAPARLRWLRQAPKFSCTAVTASKTTASSPRYAKPEPYAGKPPVRLCAGACNETHVTPLLLRLPVLCRFSDAGNDGAIDALGRPASEKRQGRKSRSVVQRRCGVRYGDLAAGLGLKRSNRSGCGGWFGADRG